jgi:glutaconate CoA-transferase, subunit A
LEAERIRRADILEEDAVGDKRISEDELISQLADGMTIGIGGWGSRRKPMSLVRALARSDLRDLTIVSYGGPDVGILARCEKISRLIFGFVSLDSIPLEPYFRHARQAGQFDVMELDEGMLQWGLYAASLRLPFLPTRAGLGSDVMTYNPAIRTVTSPYEDGEELVAMPALELDAALVHVHRADALGNGAVFGPDAFFDDLFLGAARLGFVSTESVVETENLFEGGPPTLAIDRMLVDGVVAAPYGAHFTSCTPSYERDEDLQRLYAAAAKDEEAWQRFFQEFVAPAHGAYVSGIERGSWSGVSS